MNPDLGRLCDLLARLVAIDSQNPPGREIEAAPSSCLSRLFCENAVKFYRLY